MKNNSWYYFDVRGRGERRVEGAPMKPRSKHNDAANEFSLEWPRLIGGIKGHLMPLHGLAPWTQRLRFPFFLRGWVSFGIYFFFGGGGGARGREGGRAVIFSSFFSSFCLYCGAFFSSLVIFPSVSLLFYFLSFFFVLLFLVDFPRRYFSFPSFNFFY